MIVLSTASAQTTTQGLDALSDDALMNELATRGLNSLLDRAFEVNRAPENERQARRTLISLARLNDPNAHLTAAQRQQLIAQIVAGVDQALPTIKDPSLLMREASVLILQGAERDVNTLEYWGENAHTQASLRPVMQAVTRILDRCAELAKAQADEAANKITAAGGAAAEKYEQLDLLARTAVYTKQMVAYYLALSLDSASPLRKQVAADATEYLKQFDQPEIADRNIVRNRMAKLAMVQGDFDTARKIFAVVMSDTADPKPTMVKPYEVIYEAKYFSAVAAVLAKNSAAARQGLEDLQAWQLANLPNDKDSQDRAQAAAALLQYRIQSLDGELATNPADKAKADDAAIAILTDLLNKRPDLRGVIYDLLLPRLGDRVDLKQAEPILLSGLVAKGEEQTRKGKDESIDEKALARAVDAAAEIARRNKEGAAIDPQLVNNSALLMPFFLDRLNRKPEAASAFLDYVEQNKTSDLKNATIALDYARATIGQLREDPKTREDPAVTRAYERFLPIAIGEPFNRREFAFEYAMRLQLNGRSADAVKYFRLVPDNDARALRARFQELVALVGSLDELPANSPDRAKALSDIQKLADQVSAAVNQALAAAKTDSDRTAARSMKSQTALLAADLARREQKDPQRALQLLDGFESDVTGLPNADSLIHEAMYIRVQSYMSAEKYSDATQELVKLLGKTEGGQGAQIVYNLLEKLNADFDRAQRAGDRPAMKTLARNRAQLSGFLVTWTEQNQDPGIRKYTYRYRVFDAETQRRAADLEDDAAARKRGLNTALQRYQALQSPQNLALYKASLDPQQAADPDLYDPQVTFGIALIQFDLGDYEQAAAAFSRLITQRRLGPPIYTVTENGDQKQVDNDQYWEAVLKLIRCNQHLGKGVEESKTFLKMQYIPYGAHVGGKQWKEEFEKLRKELIPDFKIDDLVASPTTRQ